MADYKELRVLSGTSHLKLTDSICEYLGISNGRLNIHKFANDNTFVQIEENIRETGIFRQEMSETENIIHFELVAFIRGAEYGLLPLCILLDSPIHGVKGHGRTG